MPEMRRVSCPNTVLARPRPEYDSSPFRQLVNPASHNPKLPPPIALASEVRVVWANPGKAGYKCTFCGHKGHEFA